MRLNTASLLPMATPVAVALALALSACGGGSSNSDKLIVDNNANSCSVLKNDGSAVVVGSGVAGDPAAPEPASGYRLGYKAKHSNSYMVVANTPLASKAGCEVLRAGGTAADAAVAVQAVLGLVEPQSSTVAGSAFMMYYDAATKQVTAYDGRESAPAAATGYYLVRQDQADPASPTPVPTARRSGRSIGVPGVMRMMEMAQKEHGKLKWNQLFDDGINLATDGFVIPSRMGDAITSNRASLALDAEAVAAYFKADGTPKQAGEATTNAPYAKTLQALAAQGADALHNGPIAAGHRRQGRAERGRRRREDADHARPDDAGGPGQLQAAEAHAGLHPLPRVLRLLDGATVLRRHCDRAGARHSGAVPARVLRADEPGERRRRPERDGRAPGVGGLPACLCRPRQVRGRHGLHPAAGQSASRRCSTGTT